MTSITLLRQKADELFKAAERDSDRAAPLFTASALLLIAAELHDLGAQLEEFPRPRLRP